MKIKTKRICAGYYEVTDGKRIVSISFVDFYDGPAWIARAEWDKFLYTDPLELKRYAVEDAINMLETA